MQRGQTRVTLTGRVMRVAAILFCAGWRVSTLELVEAIYGDQPEGGPLDAKGAAGQFILRCRRALSCLGVDIVHGYGQVGYTLAFRAVPHNAAAATFRLSGNEIVGGDVAAVA